jgi:hypothetical protein
MNNWSALNLTNQVAGELGLVQPTTMFGTDDIQSLQFLALLNSVGNELNTYYPWEQFTKVWTFNTVEGQDAYDLPDDWKYFVDQTQWDQTNHWPLLGPRSPQEWSWLKGGLVAAAPRMRYRVYQDKFWVHPVPGSTSFTFRMEYIVRNWVSHTSAPLGDMVQFDDDVVLYDPWLVTKYIKMKFYELKGFDTTAVQGDFSRVFKSLVGKDKGAPILSLSPHYSPVFIGPWSVPDGSWVV